MKKAILAYVRDDEVPGVNDIGFPPTVVWDNVTYEDPIVYKDFSTRMGSGESIADRGYVVHRRYSWKVRPLQLVPTSNECFLPPDLQ